MWSSGQDQEILLFLKIPREFYASHSLGLIFCLCMFSIYSKYILYIVILYIAICLNDLCYMGLILMNNHHPSLLLLVALSFVKSQFRVEIFVPVPCLLSSVFLYWDDDYQ